MQKITSQALQIFDKLPKVPAPIVLLLVVCLPIGVHQRTDAFNSNPLLELTRKTPAISKSNNSQNANQKQILNNAILEFANKNNYQGQRYTLEQGSYQNLMKVLNDSKSTKNIELAFSLGQTLGLLEARGTTFQNGENHLDTQINQALCKLLKMNNIK